MPITEILAPKPRIDLIKFQRITPIGKGLPSIEVGLKKDSQSEGITGARENKESKSEKVGIEAPFKVLKHIQKRRRTTTSLKKLPTSPLACP